MLPTVYHNGNPYNVDFTKFLALSPLANELYQQNSALPMNISDGLDENDFQVLVAAINNNTNTIINSAQLAPCLLKSSIIYKIQDFIEEACKFIIGLNDDNNIFSIFSFLNMSYAISTTMDKYIASNIVKFCQFPDFMKLRPHLIMRLLTLYGIEPPKDQIFINFILNYLKNTGKEACPLLSFVDFKEVPIEELENLILNDLIDFDLVGEKILNEVKIVVQNFENRLYTKPTEISMENYESNLKISEKDYQAEIDAVDALKFEADQLQLELSKLESSFKTVMKQSSNATTKKQALEKEKAEMEAKLNHEEEEEKIEFVEEEEEKNEEQQQQPATMPLWSPKSELKPPQKPFVESQYLENIEKADNFMKIAPTEALKQCFKLIDQRDLNHKAALVDFLYHCAVEMKQPEMCSSLAALLAAKDKTCDDFAVSLLLFAASKDIPDALFNLGVMTRLGRGVMQNDEAAAQMIIKAANMGFEQALQAAGAAC